ncbi:MAG: adenosine deaminase [Tatlockia sp.]|jgi:adenosine deaminase
MKRFFYLLPLLVFYSLSQASVSDYFDQIKSEPNALYAFLKDMPKGGELHYHLTGGAYPEYMLQLAAKGDFCLNPDTFRMIKTDASSCQGVSASKLLRMPALYDKTVRAWSFKDFIESKSESNHDHFFASFYKFPIAVEHDAELLSDVMQRAATQHELYMEIQMLPDSGHSGDFAAEIADLKNLSEMQHKLLADPLFQLNIQNTIDKSDTLLQQARNNLGCTEKPEQPVCQIKVVFQYYALREQPLPRVFAQALTGFIVAQRANDLVGVNLVQAEDALPSLRDYRQQMQVFNFLHKAYPKVHIALHAGELSPASVTPEDLRFHIHDAIFTGNAERIGHGVDIAFEDNAEALLDYMAKKEIAVEINLSSNQTILHIAGKKHPLNYYLCHEVPVVLSTDDEGILRTDLTRQYVKAVLEHGIDYPTLKHINRNALTYSFLPGQSLWSNAKLATPVSACQDLNSPDCLDFIKRSEKAKLQRQLELNLLSFEKGYEKANPVAKPALPPKASQRCPALSFE